MKILAIETSCDETGISLVKASGGKASPQFKVLKNIIATQIKAHRPFGGVVPNIAKREHIKNLPLTLKKIGSLKDVDLIAVTVGPGLSPALWQGIEFAKEFSKKLNKPLIGVNHLEGHLYSPLLSRNNKLKFPAVGLSVSGGHTNIVLLKSLLKFKKLGETRDDAAGEAFDKVGKMLKLPYPGGPEIEKLARKGNAKAIRFPRPMIGEKSFEFSFSGIKTSVLYYLRDHKRANKADIAASFQEAVIDILLNKLMKAAVKYKARSLFLCGGVAANKELRRQLKNEAEEAKLELIVPDMAYNTDNAAMIAAAGYLNYLKKRNRKITAQPTLDLK